MAYIDDAQKQEEISREIAGLLQLGRPDLKQRWRALYGTEPPRKISRDLLLRAVAYRIQEQAFGGMRHQRGACSSRSRTNSMDAGESESYRDQASPREPS